MGDASFSWGAGAACAPLGADQRLACSVRQPHLHRRSAPVLDLPRPRHGPAGRRDKSSVGGGCAGRATRRWRRTEHKGRKVRPPTPRFVGQRLRSWGGAHNAPATASAFRLRCWTGLRATSCVRAPPPAAPITTETSDHPSSRSRCAAVGWRHAGPGTAESCPRASAGSA